MSHHCTLDGACERPPPLPEEARPHRLELEKVWLEDENGVPFPVVPDDALLEVAHLRRIDCSEYSRCLDYAACQNWDAWDCTSCPAYRPAPAEEVQPRERCVAHQSIHTVMR